MEGASNNIKDFISKVDKLCHEHGMQILPNPDKKEGEKDTIIVTDGNEIVKLVYIDGDGCNF